jgi:2-hydroxycyclohexanecarboxyl-CoA dehydrogenase
MSRVAVVTGGASGVGLAICRHLADHGHRVAVLDVNGEGAQRAAQDLRASGAQAIASKVDVADHLSVDDAMRKVRSEFGPVEIMVTSAGIGAFEDFADITLELWNRIIAVNLTGTFLCVQAVILDMMAAKWGRIVTISSGAGQQGAARVVHYSAAKGGVISLTKALAREYGPLGITANTLAPGPIDTPMIRRSQAEGDMPSNESLAARIPLGRTGTPDDVAATCAFLCSDEAGYVTGQVIGVNGGTQ